MYQLEYIGSTYTEAKNELSGENKPEVWCSSCLHTLFALLQHSHMLSVMQQPTRTYNMKYHFSHVHPNVKGLQLQKYTHLWELLNSEITKMKEKWADCQHVVMRHTKKSKPPPLVISEAHCSHIPSRYVFGVFCINWLHIHLFQQ